MRSPQPIFDGHNDVLLRLRVHGGAQAAQGFVHGDDSGHLDLPRARSAGFAGGMFAMFVDAASTDDAHEAANALMAAASYDVPLPPPLDPEFAA